ncbi:adenylate/guanylate cyclase domain-containing protein [Fulvivirga maritima]|uniref:adenylate/guanylate cyclase domain-containing protein n=1 Tax=Fulvivirga maritima TaxID=2904247 RepID=UPI001F39A546|nr:adenylate/guanylate cyclase domain-containing protein [Fulvivirga maritima]UII27210.1 adenylate/guanylate cyclase domain-containing protein [Fulvivirga maritima]
MDKNLTLVGEKSFNIPPEKTILQASLDEGIPFRYECGGKARCSTCRILIEEGAENLSEMTLGERHLRSQINLSENVRLACQTCVKKGKVKVKRIMKDKTDYELYIRKSNGETTSMGKELQLCLFFLDIRNFTRFMELHLAFDAIHLIRKLFNSFERIINDHHGKIIETAGDGLYAAFGFKDQPIEAANHAVKSGFEIIEKLKELNNEYFKQHFGEFIQVGIGIHYGKVATGDIMLEGRQHKLVMGYPVNIAARIQELTKKYKNNFIISDKVFILLQTPPKSEQITEIIRGTGERINIHVIGEPYELPLTS